MNDPLDGIISHPGEDGGPEVPLDKHLQVVADRMVELGALSDSDEPSAADVAHRVGRLHDFGKVTPAFQQHVREEYHGERKYTFHSRIGSLATAHALLRMGATKLDVLAGCLAVAHHHGRLKDTAHYLATDVIEAERATNAPNGWVRRQVVQIDDKCADAADALLRTASDDMATWASFHEAVDSDALFEDLEVLVTVSVGFARDVEPDALPEGVYDRFLRHWGVLTISDKTPRFGPDDGGFDEPAPTTTVGHRAGRARRGRDTAEGISFRRTHGGTERSS